MSRIAKQPVVIPSDTEVQLNGQTLTVKGAKGNMTREINQRVVVKLEDNQLLYSAVSEQDNAIAGTERMLGFNMVYGCQKGFEKRLKLVGIGYRAQMKGNVLNLTLGFSHDINHPVPETLTIQTPSQTEVIVTGADKQLVGQTAAEIRAYRPPEPYKGKGVQYVGEKVRRKAVKKK